MGSFGTPGPHLHRRPSGDPHDPLTPGGMEQHFANLHGALNHHGASGSVPFDNTHRHGNINSYGTPEPMFSGLTDHPRPVVDVKVTESLPKDGTQVIWDQAFVFDMLRKPDDIHDKARPEEEQVTQNTRLAPRAARRAPRAARLTPHTTQTIEQQEREDEERELLGIINDSGQLGQRDLLSLADGTPMDLDRDAVLDADATLLLRVFDDNPSAADKNLIGQVR